VKVRFSEAATADLDDIFEFVVAESPSAARTLVERLAEATDRLAAHPRLGRQGRSLGTRELVIPRTPYFAVYEIEGDVVRILRVMHGRRRWPPA
jgi:addiction module RelE/StbE family toxin